MYNGEVVAETIKYKNYKLREISAGGGNGGDVMEKGEKRGCV